MPKKRMQLKTPDSVQNVIVPVFIPTADGAGDIELGLASVKANTLVIEFNGKLPSEAIRRRIMRGDVVGVTFVIPQDEAAAAEEAEEQCAQDIREHQAGQDVDPSEI